MGVRVAVGSGVGVGVGVGGMGVSVGTGAGVDVSRVGSAFDGPQAERKKRDTREKRWTR